MRSISLLVRDNLQKPNSGVAAAKGKSKGKWKNKHVEIAHHGQQKVSALQETKVVLNTIQRRSGEPKGKR